MAVKDLNWYVEEVERMVTECKSEATPNAYSGFYFASEPKRIGYICREVHTAWCHIKYRKNGRKPTEVYFNCSTFAEPKQGATQLANLMRGVHLTETDFGFEPAQFTLVARRQSPRQTNFSLKMVGDPRWHYAIPVYSVLITDARRYFKSTRPGRRMPRSLTHRLVVARGLEDLFGSDPCIDWQEHRYYNGRVSYERRIKRNKSRWERYGLSQHSTTNRWQIKPPQGRKCVG